MSTQPSQTQGTAEGLHLPVSTHSASMFEVVQTSITTLSAHALQNETGDVTMVEAWLSLDTQMALLRLREDYDLD